MPMFHITSSHVDKPPVLPGLKTNHNPRRSALDCVSSESIRANEQSLPQDNESEAYKT